MKQSLLFLILFFTFSVFGQNATLQTRVIVKLKNQVVLKSATAQSQSAAINQKIASITQNGAFSKINAPIIGGENMQPIYVLQLLDSANLQQTLDSLNANVDIEYAEPDFVGAGGGSESVVPNDQLYARQWGLKNNGTFSLSTAVVGADIEMEKAWAIEQGDTNVVVAIIDSGSKMDHPEFAGRIWKNTDEKPGNGIDDDKNGYIDDVNGWDFANLDNLPTDDNKHGTNVAGIVGANGNNSIGFAGVDWNCKLMILKALDKDNLGYYSWWINAINYAVDNGAKVINLSLGGTSASQMLQDAIAYALRKNVVVVVCMMNTNSNTVYYPAAYSGVIAVGAVSTDDKRAQPFPWGATSGSNFGAHISVVAPGNYIYGLRHTSDTNYDTYLSGTSQATPHVTGLAALLLAQNPNRTPAQIKSIIESTAEDQVGNPVEDTKGWDQYYGFGRINAYKALSVITNNRAEHFEDNAFSIFPNPFSIQTTVATNDALTNATLTLINCLGQIVYTKENVSGQSVAIQRNNLTAGVYTVLISQNNQFVYKSKIVISN